jgi:phage terminase small subunit
VDLIGHGTPDHVEVLLAEDNVCFPGEYLIDLNATQAAIRAGYSAKAARFVGCKNITKANIAAAIEKAQTKRAERAELTGDMVVDELRKIAGAKPDPKAYVA